MSATSHPTQSSVPLCVDLDGTLIRSDMLWESLMQLLHHNPAYAFLLPFWLLRGRAHFKKQIAQRVKLDVTVLPYHEELLGFLRTEHESGRVLILATAADQRHARQVVDHLGLPMEVLSSDGDVNLSGKNKARLLSSRFGAKGFDYAGNATVDLPVWAEARQAVVVNAGANLLQKARKVSSVSHVFSGSRSGVRAVIKAIRPHQWVKNLIVCLPLVGAHKLGDFHLVANTLLAFASFSLCASGAYVLNDLWDVEADRHHPSKKFRPFAAGHLSLPFGIVLTMVCLGLSVTAALWLPWDFLGVLAFYLVLTVAYSWRLKKVALLDVFVLAGLYTIRLIAGQAATGIENSFWLLAVSLFIFLSLALAKRFTELYGLRQQKKDESKGRGYRSSDLELVAMCGIVSGFLAVLVLVFYVHSPEVVALYRRPTALLSVCPLMLYWVCHVWLTAHRGKMHDDPIVFALKDKQSWCIGLLLLVIAAVASPI